MSAIKTTLDNLLVMGDKLLTQPRDRTSNPIFRVRAFSNLAVLADGV